VADEGNEEEDQAHGGSEEAPQPLSAEEIRARRLARMEQDHQQKADEDQSKEKAGSGQEVANEVEDVSTATASAAESVEPPKPPKNGGENEEQSVKKAKRAVDPVDETLTRVFQFCVGPKRGAGTSLVRLRELEQDSGATTLNQDNIEEALYTRLAMLPIDLPEGMQRQSPFEFLMSCFERIDNIRRDGKEGAEVMELLERCSEFIVSYAVTILMEPEMFPLPNGSSSPQAILLKAIEGRDAANTSVSWTTAARAMMKSFADEALKQDSMEAILQPLLNMIRKEIKDTVGSAAPFQMGPCIAMGSFCAQKPFGSYIAEVVSKERESNDYTQVKSIRTENPQLPPGVDQSHPLYDMMLNMLRARGENQKNGRRIELESFWGPFFQPSVLLPQVMRDVYKNVLQRPMSDLNGIEKTMQGQASALQSELGRCILNICKSGSVPRNQIMDYFADILQLNSARSQMQPQRTEVSSDGFALNTCAVLLHLCRPFLKADSDKVGLIEDDFKTRAFPDDLTRLCRDDMATDMEVSSDKQENEFHFVTRCFFYGLRAVHLGPVSVVRQIETFERHLSYMQRTLGMDMLGPLAPPSNERSEFASLLQRFHALRCATFEPAIMHNCIRLHALYCRYLISRAEGRLLTSLDDVKVPLKADPEPNKIVKRTPEHFLDDATHLLKSIALHAPVVLDGADQDCLSQLVTSFVVFMSSPKYVRSPHVRASFAESLFAAFLPDTHKGDERKTNGVASTQDVRAHLLSSSEVAKRNLAPGLLQLYGDVEACGYYEAIGYRHHIALLLKYLWNVAKHQEAFHSFASSTPERFVKFANGIINQTNDGVADSLQRLREIKKTQDETNGPGWSNLGEEERRQRTQGLEENERFVSSALLLAGEVIQMLRYLSLDDVFVKAFMVQSLVHRLAGMLSSILISLSGKRGVEFKIQEPEKYNFHPKDLLASVYQTMARFYAGSDAAFTTAVASCAFFNEELFTKATVTVRKFSLHGEDVITSFEELKEAALKEAARIQHEESVFDDAPEEFLDPLMQEVMDDPVLLPTSNTVIDRIVIEQHLLNDQTDPFNRSPLSLEMLKPQPELKARIEEWKAKTRSQSQLK